MRHRLPRIRPAAGFTLIEFLVAMALFAVIAGAAFSLFAQHAPYFTRQQNLAGVNIQLQNALTQMQLDVVNAGSGYYQNINTPSWPLGLTILNQNAYNSTTSSGTPPSPCNVPATFTYTATCFDTLSILNINPAVPATHATDATGGTGTSNCSDTDSSSSFYIQPAYGLTAAQTATGYSVGDQVLLVVNSPSGIGKVGTFVISGTPVVGANYVMLPHAESTDAQATITGTNEQPTVVTYQTNTAANDPLNISVPDAAGNSSLAVYNQFCGPDWVLKLSPIVYSVDSSTDPNNPVLTRTEGGTVSTIADQIIGFKVGAAIFGDNTGTPYHYDPDDYLNDPTTIRSIQVSLIGRTNPDPDATFTFQNSFDQGRYQVVGATVVINPRNLSMGGY